MDPGALKVVAALLAMLGAILVQVATPNPIDNLIGLGVGGAIAGATVWWKRQDNQRHKEELKRIFEAHAAELKEIINRQQTLEEKNQAIAIKHNETLSTMQATLSQNTSLSRIEERIEQLASARKDART